MAPDHKTIAMLACELCGDPGDLIFEVGEQGEPRSFQTAE